MAGGRRFASGPRTQMIETTARIPRLATASLFLASRCQASRQREVPCSTGSHPAGAMSGESGAVAMSLDLQFRVEPDLRDVHQQVEEDDEHGVKQDRSQH